MKRRTFIPLSAAALLPGFATQARAQPYPSRPITLVVPAQAGGSADLLARAMGQQIATKTGQSVIVENKPGANMQLAAQAVASAKPDGHTVFLSGNAAFTVNQHLFKRLTYDPITSFAPVTTVAKGAWMWAVNPQQIPVKTIPELIQFAKQRPGKLTFADTSPVTRVLAEIIQQKSGTKFLPVPYRVASQAVPDLLSGRIDMVFIDSSVMKLATDGSVNIMAWTDSKRSTYFPNVPTLEEGGLPGAAVYFWMAAYTPAGTPAAVNEKLAALLAVATEAPEVAHIHQLLGAYPYVVAGAKLAEMQMAEAAQWAQLIKNAELEKQ